MAGSTVGMGFLDVDLRFMEGNRALAAALGVETLVGLPLSAVSPAGARTESLVGAVLRSGRPITVDAPTGRISYYRVVDRGGAPLGVGVVTVGDSKGLRHLAQLKVEAETDGLTGLVNHRAFQERLQMEFNRAQRHERPLALAMVDVDGFKHLNDTFGHQAGDDALQRVAAHLTAAVRVNDTVARVGGDEFALLLPETTGAAAQTVIERAHAHIRKETRREGSLDLTVSIGICDLRHARTADELLRFADGALYWAKAHGRDAVYQYSPETVEDLSREQRSERLLRDKALAGIRSLARAIDAKDHSTLLHSERVASLAARLAEATGWSALRVAALREAALIHDVGKIGVPIDALLKPGPLTAAEYAVVKSHAELGAVIAGEVLSEQQTSWVRGHHERFDGMGYPDGLAGDAIPEGALLLGLSDSWDVMTSERAYSRAMNPTEAIAECRRCAGTQFSPAVVAILTRPGFERVLRMFANEQATRDRNEASLADDEGITFNLHCECGAEDCPEMIEIPAEEYRSVRQAERRYIVCAGHEIAEIEDTLVKTDSYSIVEKV